MSKRKTKKRKDSEMISLEEIQSGVNLAYALCLLVLAEGEGLLKGPHLELTNCTDLILEGRMLGVEPCRRCVIQIMSKLISAAQLPDDLTRQFAAKIYEEFTRR